MAQTPRAQGTTGVARITENRPLHQMGEVGDSVEPRRVQGDSNGVRSGQRGQ